MAYRNAYTEQEQATILRHVKNSPNNLSFAFGQAAAEIGRKQCQVSAQWYKTLKHKKSAMVLASECGMVINTKNTIIREDETAMDVIKMCLQRLSKQQKIAIIGMLVN